MKKFSLSALVAAGLLAGGMTTGAHAADLGGDCCADLEERIAELEATTARKGNRKVSLTVSGFVAQQVLFWDDGVEDNVYVTDTGSVSIGTNFSFTGRAQINSEWSAGYVLKIEAINNDSLLVSQNNDEGILNPGGNAMALLQGSTGALAVESAYWYLKSKRLGRLSVGQQSSAADNQAILPDGSGSLVPANYVLYDSNAFFIRRSGAANNTAGFVWGHLANCQTLDAYGGAAGDCDGVPHNNVRYDSPTVGGFSASASWGEDDMWAVSGRYAGQLGDFKIAGAIAYNHSTDEGGTGVAIGGAGNGGLDVGFFQLGAFAMHNPTGLFVYGAYGTENNETTDAIRGNGQTTPEGDFWYIKPGLRRKFNSLGHTVMYFEYGKKEDHFATFMYDAGVNSTELQHYGLGVVQEVDAAAMSFWLAWRHYEADVNCTDQAAGSCAGINLTNGGANNLEDLDVVKFGALINF